MLTLGSKYLVYCDPFSSVTVTDMSINNHPITSWEGKLEADAGPMHKGSYPLSVGM